MKKIIYQILIGLLILTSCSPKIPDGTYNLSIYATNDLHGRFFDSLYTSVGVNPYSLSSVYRYISEIRDTSKLKPILIDVGDNLQGDNATFYFNFIDTNGTHLFADIAQFIGYDAIVPGNHDFETGHKVYDKINAQLPSPYIAANAINRETGKAYFSNYKIIKRGNIKIAIIGMTNPYISNWLSEDLWRGIEFVDIIKPAQSIINYLKQYEKPHIIILATHTGIGDQTGNSPENRSKYAAIHLKDIDAVIAAHDHMTYSEKIARDSDSVILIEAGSRASGLSNVNFNLKFKNGKLISKISSGKVISMEKIKGDKEYNKRFSVQYNKVKEFTNKKIATIDKLISSRESFFEPSSYMNLIHQVQISSTGAQISFAAPLTFDLYIPSGDVNYQSLLTLYPFENQLYVMNLTGKEIKDYLEFSYNQWIYTMKSPDEQMLQIRKRGESNRYSFINPTYNFDSAFGIDYTVDLTHDFGDRIRINSLSNGENFDNDAYYKVAISSYRASGGGGLLEFGSKLGKEERESRIVMKMGDIRELIYGFLVSGKKIIDSQNWKFIPAEYLEKAKKREYQLIFPN